MAPRPLRIAWIGFEPRETGGVPGVVGDLLYGLLRLGHRVDCYFSGDEFELPQRVRGFENLTVVWGNPGWHVNRWYSRTRLAGTVSHTVLRLLASLRLRRKVMEAHEREPYDLAYEFATVENLALPARLRRTVPLVVHPETHSAGELRALLAERRLSLRCQPRRTLLVGAVVLSLRTLVQRRRIRRASLLVCISSVFRDHMVADYRFPIERTVVVPNPVRLERFAEVHSTSGAPPVVLVLGRIAARKGIEDVVAIARLLDQRGEDVRFRVVGRTSLWSNYLRLLDDLPAANSEYVGGIRSSAVPAEIAGADVLLQASKYEPFALTVAEALACGVPVVATSEVGAIEGVDPSVAYVAEPGDVEAMAGAIVETVARVAVERDAIAATARSEARRLFAPERVGEQLAAALQQLIGTEREARVEPPGVEPQTAR